MKERNRRIINVGAIFCLISLLIGIIFMQSKKTDKFYSELDRELLRSANYAQVTEKDTKIEGTDYVRFSAFFTRDLNNDGKAEKLLGTCRNMSSTDILYLDLNVLSNGYLRDGKITINGTNFNYSMNSVKDKVLKNNYISSDVKLIELNQVNAGTQKLILGSVVANIGNDINNYSKVSSITLTGTHVSDEGVETEISKTVDLTVDWHGETKAKLYMDYGATTFTYYYDELDTTTISFNFRLDEFNKQLLLKENVATIQIPDLNGYAAKEVKCTNNNVESSYNSQNKILTIKRTSTINDEGIITNTLSRNNSYTVEVTYPKEAYEQIVSYQEITIPVKGYYLGYNNTNNEFSNPYKSNEVNGELTLIFKSKPTDEIYNFSVDFVDKTKVTKPDHRYVVSKQDILNYYDNDAEVKNKEYLVNWSAIRGTAGEVPSMVMSETKDDDSYGDEWNSIIMQNYVINTGIYFKYATEMLGEDGTITVYNNDTNELIHKFTKQDWNNYTRENPYKYEQPVRHIRVETSKANLDTVLMVYNIKELEVSKVLEDFTKEQVKDINVIYTYLTGVCEIVGQDKGVIKDVDYAHYVSDISDTEISVRNKKLSTQETIENQIINIKTVCNQVGDSNWKNGEFLVEFPEEIANIEINNIDVSDNNVQILAYDLFEQDEKYFVKIITANEEPTTYTITIDCNMTPDPRTATVDKNIKLYSYNAYCNDYYFLERDTYDVDSDNNVYERVGIARETLNFVSPTDLITLQTISNYNEEQEITVAPNVAAVDKDTRKATINVSFTNNYTNTVSGIQILGKIPFEGNTYIINGKDLKSKFTVAMSNKGIQVPQELQGKVTVYYSENEKPTKDLFNKNNGWKLKENVQDFSKIRTYFIDLKENNIEVAKGYTFSYEVDIPENLDYNLATYSNHTVYYELNTDQGRLSLYTEPNKVGLRITKKINFELTKYKEGTENLTVPKAIYTLEVSEDEETTKTRILTTNNEGKIQVKNIYVGLEYTVKEFKSPENYKLNDEVIKFIVNEENGVLKLQSDYNNISLDEVNNIVKIKTEDEPKYNLNIIKIDEKTGEPIPNIIFYAGEKGTITERDGKATIDRLEINKEYTLKENKPDDYYKLTDITFKLVKDENGNLSVQSENAAFKNAIIENKDTEDLINVTVTLTNEKIPTYDLQILKVKENFEETDISKLEPLAGAKFTIVSEDNNNLYNYYQTDKNGVINLYNLYQYVEGKDITGNYMLQEVEAPAGYANNAEEIKFRVSKNAENNLIIEIQNRENLESVKDVIIEGTTIKFIIQDKPLFKLTKIDDETGKKLANVKFAIYEIDEQGHEFGFAKDINGNYVGEQDENGYYFVKTDDNGEIMLPLKSGLYKAVEMEFPEGYEEYAIEKVFKVEGEDKEESEEEVTGEIIEINYIEDLVDLSNRSIAGETFSDKIVILKRTLDFNDDSSYKNANDTATYSDYNKDGISEEIKKELTTGKGFIPIGVAYAFSGTFDGQKHEIRNIYINPQQVMDCGLFTSIENAIIRNLGITGEITAGTLSDCGGIAANASDSVISNCYNKAKISSILYSGGIVAYAYDCVISNCYNTAIVLGKGDVGGIVGYAQNTNISNCYNKGKINEDYAEVKDRYSSSGGIVGASGICNIINCYNFGEINGGYNAGGIVASSGRDNINNCYNTGKVQAKVSGAMLIFAGGIIGDGAAEISNCYNSGEIIATQLGGIMVGGIAGRNTYVNEEDSISNCYNIGNLISISTTGGFQFVGAINGDGLGSGNTCIKIENCYYLDNINMIGTKVICEGETSASNDYLKSQEFYNVLNTDNVWAYRNNSYPVLNVVPVNVKEATEVTVKNSIKKYEITTEIAMNSENQRGEGSITGNYTGFYKKENNIKYVETVSYNSSNTKEIIIDPETNYSIYKIIINEQEIQFTLDEQGNYKIPIGYLNEIKEDKHIQVIFEKNNKITITKVDEETNNPIANTKFSIYSLTPGLKVVDYAKSAKGQYIGTQQENGVYTVSSNLNGEIVLSLPSGYYKLVEVESAKGYTLKDTEPIYIKVNDGIVEEINANADATEEFEETNADYTINSIEDLVELSNRVNSGESFEGKTVVLGKTLDFNDDSSYKNPQDNTTYGDYNGDGTLESIKQELTNISVGTGFKAIGNNENTFKGTFDGKGYEIKNLKVYANNGSLYGGAFGKIVSAKIMNIGIVDAKVISNSLSSGGLIGNASDSKIINCYNTGNFQTENRAPVAGIVGEVTNSKLINCYNESDLTATCAGGIAYIIQNSTLQDCYNTGNVTASSSPAAGIVYNISNSTITDCYNTGEITGYYGAGGISYNFTNNKINNSYNTGNITTTGSGYAGGIVGNDVIDSTISNCYNTGIIKNNSTSSSASAGGIAAYGVRNSSIENCYNTGDVTCEKGYAAGIGVILTSANILDCYNTGNVTGMNGIGGIAYNSNDSTINYCKNAGSITTTGYPAGGIVSNASNTIISNCSNSGKVSNNCSGGIAYSITNNSVLKNCYNTGNIVSTSSPAAGIVWSTTNSEVANCYNIGLIESAISMNYGMSYSISNSTVSGVYYLNTSALQGSYSSADSKGVCEAITQEEIQSEEFVELLNNNKNVVERESVLLNWEYQENSYPTLEKLQIIEEKEIIVTNKKGENIEKNAVIYKVDKDTKKKLAGAKFNIENISNFNYLIGEMQSNSTYGFVKSGTQYYSNNYNKASTTANAYFPIDLRQYDGNYKLTLNYRISSQAGYDYGYATITTTTYVPGYNTNNNDINTSYRFIYTSGSYSNQNASIDLVGGKLYYLHIGYYKDGSTNSNNDRFYINNMNLIHNSTTVQSDEQGIASLKLPKGSYRVTEVRAPYGYVLDSTPQILNIAYINDINEITFENEKEENEFNKENFILTKKDKETQEVLQGVKFCILDANGNYAKDYTGSIVGQKEEIDGEIKYVLTTDANGQIKLKLNTGKYNLIEVKPLEGYSLEPEQDFEITNNNVDYEIFCQANMISNYYPWKNYIIGTSDGGTIQTNMGATKLIPAQDTVDNKQIQVTSDKGYIVKYNKAGKVEKLLQMEGFVYGTEVYEDSDGNYIVIGAGTQTKVPAENTVSGNEITLEYTGTSNRTIILKLNKDFKVIWAKDIDSFYPSNTNINYISENKNGNYIINFVNYSGNSVVIPAEDTASGEELNISRSNYAAFIEYTKDGKVKSVRHISPTIYNLVEKENGGYIVSSNSCVYELDSEMNIVKQYSLNISGISTGSSYAYWATKDEGFVVGGILTTTSLTIPGENTASGEDIVVTSNTLADSVVVKYNKDFKIEWVSVNSWTSGPGELITSIRQDVEGNYVGLLKISSNTSEYKLVKYDSNGNLISLVNIPSSLVTTDYLYTNRDNTQYVILEGSEYKFISYKIGTLNNTEVNIEVTNSKEGKVIVNHYLEETGIEYGVPPVILAEEEHLQGNVSEEYITSPNMEIQGYSLLKDEQNEYVIPDNASGTYEEEEQQVIYYYQTNPIQLVVHHYLEGTEDAIVDDEVYYYNEGEHYKVTPSEGVLKSYELVQVVGDEEKDITEDEEVIYYYRIKKYEITTRVEIPEGSEVKGGTISGEEDKPYEVVNYGNSSKKDIVITPDEYYNIKQIKLVSTNEDGNKVENIIYGENAVDDAEISYISNSDGTITLTKFNNMTEDKEVIVEFEADEGKIIIHHYIEGTTEKIYNDQVMIDLIGKQVETMPVKVENYMIIQEPENRNVTITDEIQEVIYYYQRQYNVTTDIVKYEEPNDQGIMEEVIGGTISGEDETSYESIFKGRSNQKEIVIKPYEGFQVAHILINGAEYDFFEVLNEDGSVIIEKEFFKNVQNDKHIEVDFRRNTKVTVKYLEVGTNQELAKSVTIDGYVGKDFETFRKDVPNYKVAEVGLSKLGITDENKEPVEANGQMTKDEKIIIYWYEKATSGIIVKYVEKITNTEVDEITGEEKVEIIGSILEEVVISGNVGESKETTRKEFENYISAENTEATTGINVGKDENSKIVTILQDELVEVVYWYEKEFTIATDVLEHDEVIGDGSTISVKGGSISGEDEEVYEKVIRANDSIKEIKIIPNNGYKIKTVLINGKSIYVENEIAEDGTLVLNKFINMQEDKFIEVEFERIPAKVIVQYRDVYTKESICEDIIIQGKVDEPYTSEAVEVEGYILVEPLPENSEGKITKDTITVTYWYSKQFNITTDVKEHLEDELNVLFDLKDTEIDENYKKDETSQENKVSVKGGTITGEDEQPYEIVNRGLNNTKEIKIVPDEGYRIKSVSIIKPGEIVEKLDISSILNGEIILEESYFKNIQSDIHIEVEFEKIPVTIVVNYLDKETNESIASSITCDAWLNAEYKTYAKNIKYYKLLEEELPKNAEGKLSATDNVVNYWYEKMLFNMAINKEFASILVNGNEVLKEDKKFAKIDIANTEIGNTEILVKYKITVTNTEELEGRAKIIENLPVGFKLSNITNGEWKEVDGKLELITKNIRPGQSEEYEVVLEWNKDMNCIGSLVNIAEIKYAENMANYAETTLDDNKDSCTLIIAIRTREDRDVKTIISLSCFALAGICSVVYAVLEIRARRKE